MNRFWKALLNSIIHKKNGKFGTEHRLITEQSLFQYLFIHSKQNEF